MNFSKLRIGSIKIKITIIVLLLFTLMTLILTYFSNQKLTTDYQKLLSEREFTNASYLASELNLDLTERIKALEKVASTLKPIHMNLKTAQNILENRPILHTLFNAGLFITDEKGTAIASTIYSVKQIGVNYLDRDYIFTAIHENRSIIGLPVIGKLLKTILISMSAPIHDSKGVVIGTLVGVTDLSKYNFISRMLNSYNSKNGNIKIIFPKTKMSLNIQDNKTTFNPINNIPEKYLSDFEGFSFSRSELLTAKHVPFAGWIVMTRLPKDIALLPLYHLQNWLLLRAIFLILIIGMVIWWIIKWQFSPLEKATHSLATLSITDDELNLLNEGKTDEVGSLLNNFNKLLKKLKDRETELKTVNHALHFRTSISAVMKVATTELELAQMACNIATTSEGYLMAWIGLLEFDEKKSIKPLCFSGKEEGYLENANITWENNELGQGPTGTAVREKRPVFCQDFLHDPHLAPWRKPGIKSGYRSSIALPLIIDGNVIGTYTLYGNKPNTFSKEEVNLLMDIANDIAFAISSLKLRDYKSIALETLDRKDLLLSTRAKLLVCATQYTHKDFLKHALDEISSVVKSPIAFFHKVDHDQNSLTLQDWSTRTQNEFCQAEGKGSHYNIAMAGVWADSVRSGGPIIHNDYASLPNKKGMPAGHAHVERELVVPIYRDGKPAGILGVGNKTTNYDEKDVEILTYLADVLLELFETKESAAELDSIREFNEIILDTIPFPMDIVDYNGNILFASKKMQEALKKNPTGDRCWDIYKDDKKQCKHCPLNKKSLVEKGISVETEGALGGRTLEVFHTAIKFQDKEAILEIFQDITEKKNMQAQLVQSDRMASMGMLAAGVAHEINNPLAYTLLNLEEAKEEIPESSNIRDRITDAINGVERVSKIVRGLKSFSRPENTEISLLDLNLPIEAAINMATNEIKYRAKIIKDFDASLKVLANEGQLAQVFLNLLINAAHAIPEGNTDKNSITIHSWQDEMHIYISISDTGSGIEPKILEKIFEPFFTTKASGVGSGLGLAISRNIIREIGGDITVQSVVGKGTTMTIQLKKAPEFTTSSTQTSINTEDNTKLKGRFLIVDDETEIRYSISRSLFDCEVVEADSGESACEILKADQKFDFILTDMMMPKMTGMDLYEWIEKNHPDLVKKIIFMTGAAYTERTQDFLNKVSSRKLEKPFSTNDLIQILKG